MEIIISDGMSEDRTRQVILEWKKKHPDLVVRIIDNLKRNIPSGLNRALEASEGEIIVRLDAHAVPAVDYVERCVSALQLGRGDNVGGIWKIKERPSVFPLLC